MDIIWSRPFKTTLRKNIAAQCAFNHAYKRPSFDPSASSKSVQRSSSTQDTPFRLDTLEVRTVQNVTERHTLCLVSCPGQVQIETQIGSRTKGTQICSSRLARVSHEQFHSNWTVQLARSSLEPGPIINGYRSMMMHECWC